MSGSFLYGWIRDSDRPGIENNRTYIRHWYRIFLNLAGNPGKNNILGIWIRIRISGHIWLDSESEMSEWKEKHSFLTNLELCDPCGSVSTKERIIRIRSIRISAIKGRLDDPHGSGRWRISSNNTRHKPSPPCLRNDRAAHLGVSLQVDQVDGGD